MALTIAGFGLRPWCHRTGNEAQVPQQPLLLCAEQVMLVLELDVDEDRAEKLGKKVGRREQSMFFRLADAPRLGEQPDGWERAPRAGVDDAQRDAPATMRTRRWCAPNARGTCEQRVNSVHRGAVSAQSRVAARTPGRI